MTNRAVMVVLVAMATLQVLEARTPFPDYWLEEHGSSVADSTRQSATWAASTQWLGALRSSYSQMLRFETEDTLERMRIFAVNIEATTQKYKDQVEDILADTDKPTYLRCTEDNNFKKVQEVIATEDRDLQKCATPLKTLRDEYKRALENLTAEVESRSEETIYSHCLQTDSTVRLDDDAADCFSASVQAALSSFYYPLGSTVLRTVTEYRSSIAHAQSEARACAAASTHEQSMMRDLEATTSCLNSSRQRVRRGFGKKFKKFFKKAKHVVKKVCSTVPCRVGVSVPFG